MNREVLIKYYLLASMLSFGVVAQAQITSSFDTNIDGWTAAGSLGDLVSHIPSGGNPGGYISATPTWTGTIGVFPVYFYFSAPNKFLGNFSSYYNGNITFDLRQGVLTTAVVRPEVIISDGITPLYYFPPTPFNPPTSGWTTYSVILSASSGYWKTTNSDTGPAATALQIQTVLSNITIFAIRGRFNSVASPPATSLDNVVMQPLINILAQPMPQNVCAGVNATLTTAATGNNNIGYNWQIFNSLIGGYSDLTNNAVYSGVNSPTLAINTTGVAGGGNYRCRVSGTNTPNAFTNIVTVTVNPVPTAPGATGNTACGSSAITLNASGGSAGQYRWYTVSTGGTPIAGQVNSAYTTPVIAGTTTYYVSINNGTCESIRTPVVATINSIPTAPSATGNTACGSSAITLNASGGSAGQYRWYTVSTGGTSIAGQTNSTYTTPVIAGTTTYYVSINNGTCESTRTSVTATINTIPTAPSTTGNTACGSSAVTLNASGGSAGQYRWYTVSTGGTPIAGQTNSTYTTPVIAGTTTYYVSINNGTCESARTSVTATINTIPSAPGTTGNTACGSSAITLNASGGSAGQYRWYTVSTGGTPIAGQTNSTYTTPVIAGTTTYYVSINNGTCESARTSVTATINTIPTAPSTTGNTACGSSAITLNASGGSAGQYRWYTVSTGGTAIGGQTNSTYTTPAITSTTTYYVSINNGTCESTRTSVTATINTIPTAPSTTGNTACGSAAVTLNASGGSAGQYRWYTIPTGGTAIGGQTNSTYTTPAITSTTTYYVSINNGTCESTRTSVTATINTIPTAPSTTGNSSCGSAAITLNATGGSAGQYRWYTASTGGTSITGETNSVYTTPVIAGTTTYYVSINNGTCESTRTSVVATINSIPAAPGATGNAACGSSAITLNASGGLAGQYRWYTVSAGGTPIAGEIADSYTTPLLNSTTPYYVSLNDGICESERIVAEAIINPIPSPPVTTGASNCEPGALLLAAAGAADGEFVWYDVPSGGTPFPGEVNATYTTSVLNSTTTYYVAINNGFCESSRQAVTATIGGAACTNSPPQVDTSSTSTTIAGVATIDLTILISDPDNNLDLSTLKILVSPISNAIAQINNMVLTINYSGLTFSGRDRLTIEICDLLGSCTQQEIIIDVGGDLNIYSGISPNSDLFNEKWIIQNIESLPETKSNHVSIFNRWGDVVFEVDNYDNNQNVFIGLNKSGDNLSSGIYFYKIEFSSGLKTQTGYLTLKH